MKIYISTLLLSTTVLLAAVHCAPKKVSQKSEIEKEDTAVKKKTENDSELPFPDMESVVGDIGGRIHSILNPIMQQGGIELLSLTEDLLERSTEMVDSVGELIGKVRNNTKFQTETKQKLRYLKKKARHLREDIEDQIELEKEKAKKAEGEAEKRKAEESIHLLKAARERLRDAIKGRISRNKRNPEGYSKKEEKGRVLDASKKEEKKNKESQRKEEKKNPESQKKDTKPLKKVESQEKRIVEEDKEQGFKYGLGDGFGEHSVN